MHNIVREWFVTPPWPPPTLLPIFKIPGKGEANPLRMRFKQTDQRALEHVSPRPTERPRHQQQILQFRHLTNFEPRHYSQNKAQKQWRGPEAVPKRGSHALIVPL